MAGLYIHIPFCRSRCSYCDFYSQTDATLRHRYVQAVCRELEMRQSELSEPVRTIYLGGGTPSLLDETDLQLLFDTIQRLYDLQTLSEVTIEANPDDLSKEYLHMLRSGFPFNRLSIGVQTFHDETLRLLNRRHTAEQAINAYQNAREAGFKNISIDLMYGLPLQTQTRWESDLQQALSLLSEHISAYHLTYEEGTPLFRQWQQGVVRPPDENESLLFYRTLTEKLRAAGYEHYEISNFCLPGYEAAHNSAYWQSVPYIGCGASAHSYNGIDTRRWNVADITSYMQGIFDGKPNMEQESLDTNTRYNDYIITALRTRWGADLNYVRSMFGQRLADYCRQMIQPFLVTGDAVLDTEKNTIVLTEDGMLLSDEIMRAALVTD
ncbi:MAG: radical SAM family heme chaperone HemW [Prevotellaceae bacterium]|jgi:oxygen-independent coproporphyrinogen-3 oxidase|nr:radical SAM family heme chaperone HemW [Prevotellaceae bacterium]